MGSTQLTTMQTVIRVSDDDDQQDNEVQYIGRLRSGRIRRMSDVVDLTSEDPVVIEHVDDESDSEDDVMVVGRTRSTMRHERDRNNPHSPAATAFRRRLQIIARQNDDLSTDTNRNALNDSDVILVDENENPQRPATSATRRRRTAANSVSSYQTCSNRLSPDELRMVEEFKANALRRERQTARRGRNRGSSSVNTRTDIQSHVNTTSTASTTVDLTNSTSERLNEPSTSNNETTTGLSGASITPKRQQFHCPICFDNESQIHRTGRQLMSTICGHIFCSECTDQIFTSNPSRTNKVCPTCRKRISRKSIHPIFL